MSPNALVACLAAALVLAGARPAGAQPKVPDFALDRFDPSVPVDAFFGVGSPAVGGHLVPRAVVEFEDATHPLQISTSAMSSTSVVSAQGILHAGLSLALWDRVLLSADMPFALLDSGSDPAGTGLDYHAPSSTALGDLRLGARGRIFGDMRDPFQIGIGGAVYVPTGSVDAYTSRGTTRGSIDLLLGGRAGSGVGIVWSASVGAMLEGAVVSPAVRYGAGLALVLGEDRVQIGPELYGSTQIESPAPWMVGRNNGHTPWTIVPGIPQGSMTEMELLLGAKVRLVGGLFVGAAGGFAPVAAVGAPGVRLLGSVGWTLPPPVVTQSTTTERTHDRDGDGIPDDLDACPDIKGERQSDSAKNGCPVDQGNASDVDDGFADARGPKPPPPPPPVKVDCPVDTDGDGIVDSKDACPTVRGVASMDPKKNGCPADRDGDGIPDDLDACPDTPGSPNPDPRLNGCNDDPDGDGIKGAADACPFERGERDPDPTKNGCPKFVRVTEGEILISSQVKFKPNGWHTWDAVSPVSLSLMNEIRDVIVQHPEILRIEVQGHTDDFGTAEYNEKLSQQRAEAVRQWLVEAGIPANKLVAKGYGYWKPLGDNRLHTGRDANRRVQFVILERRAK